MAINNVEKIENLEGKKHLFSKFCHVTTDMHHYIGVHEMNLHYKWGML